MDFSDIVAMAKESRERYGELELRRYGRTWDVQDLMVGFVGDVGDLAQLMGAERGVRPGPDDLHGAIAHELADCLWSVLVIAQALDIDLELAYEDLHHELLSRIAKKLNELDQSLRQPPNGAPPDGR